MVCKKKSKADMSSDKIIDELVKVAQMDSKQMRNQHIMNIFSSIESDISEIALALMSEHAELIRQYLQLIFNSDTKKDEKNEVYH